MPAPVRKFTKNYAYSSKHYLDPIGPPTTLIKPIEFINASKLTLERSKAALEGMKARLDSLDDETRDNLESRCSVESLYQSNTIKHGNPNYTVELEKWHVNRLYPGERDRAGTELDDERDDEEEEEIEIEASPAKKSPAKKSRKRRAPSQGSVEGEGGNAGGIEREGSVEGPRQKAARLATLPGNDPEILQFLAEADESSLKILKPLSDLEFYIRKTKMSDYNILSEPRQAEEVITTKPPGDSPLNSLVYTITIHPIARTVIKSVPQATRSQTMVLLGSTTLWEFVENLLVGGDEIPVVLPAVQVEKNDAEDNSEEEGEDEDEDEDDMTRALKGKGKEREHGWNEGQEIKKDDVRWGDEKRDVGSVLAIEGVLYADGREGMTDYADMVMKLIDSTPWNRIVDDQTQDNRPQYIIGPKMQDTRIGDLEIKIGEPYWFMQQGNCEHIWTVDSIRQTHSGDLQILDPKLSTIPYPYSTFLSKLIQAKCRICDRDPGCIITIDDELAGESPSLMCTKCFEMLHGENVDSKLNVIPKLIE